MMNWDEERYVFEKDDASGEGDSLGFPARDLFAYPI